MKHRHTETQTQTHKDTDTHTHTHTPQENSREVGRKPGKENVMNTKEENILKGKKWIMCQIPPKNKTR